MPKRLAIGAGGGRTPAEHEQAVGRVQIADEAGVESVWSGESVSRNQVCLDPSVYNQVDKPWLVI